MAFNKKEFDEFLLKNRVVGVKEEPFKLKSGRLSHWYVNCRVLSDTFGLIDKTAQFVIDFIKESGLDPHYIYGVPDGATKLGLMINAKIGKKNPSQKMVIGRKQPKEYGDPKDRYFIGSVEPGDKVIVVEDVTTTGGSAVEHIRFLKEANLDVVAIVSLVNRLEKRDDGMSVAEYIKKEFGVPYYWLSDGPRILPIAMQGLSEGLKAKVRENVNQYSTVPLEIK